MTVPTVTVKGLRHSLHLCTPGRVDLPLSLVMRSGSALPQCGQTGPLGHNRPSKCSRAASSSWKIGLVRSTLDLLMTHSLAGRENVASQVWYVNRIVPQLLARRERQRTLRRGLASVSRLLRSTRSEEHTAELQSLMRISYAVFFL